MGAWEGVAECVLDVEQEEEWLVEAGARSRWAGVVGVGVDAQEFRRDASGFIERHGLTYPIVRDSGGSTLKHYDVTGFPETWFVDRGGHGVGEHVSGPLTPARLVRNTELAMER